MSISIQRSGDNIICVSADPQQCEHVCVCRLYNESCEEPLPLQRSPVLCCTLDNVPLISKCGTLPPESCFFSLVCSTGSFMGSRISKERLARLLKGEMFSRSGSCWILDHTQLRGEAFASKRTKLIFGELRVNMIVPL
uniref:Transmembrane protein 150A-like n=1 Tax=Oryzias melastigma TaxID=30732 RepID=A0A3B3BA60_ORYME